MGCTDFYGLLYGESLKQAVDQPGRESVSTAHPVEEYTALWISVAITAAAFIVSLFVAAPKGETV
jgi:hypothetical protein